MPLTVEQEIAYGRHSNIPECCIKFYIEVWRLVWNTPKRKKYPFALRNGVDYVTCTECDANKTFNQLHICTAVCRPAFLED